MKTIIFLTLAGLLLITFPSTAFASRSQNPRIDPLDPLRQTYTSTWHDIEQKIDDPTQREMIAGLQIKLQKFLNDYTEILPKSYPAPSDREAFQTALLSYKYLKAIHPDLKKPPFNRLKSFLSYAWNKDKPEHGEITLALAHALMVADAFTWYDHFHDGGGTWVYKFTEKIIEESDKVILAASLKLMEKYKSDKTSVLKAEIPQIQIKATAKDNTVIIILLECAEEVEKVVPPSLRHVAGIRFHEISKYYPGTKKLIFTKRHKRLLVF